MVKTFDNKYTIANSYHNANWDINLYKVNENLEQDTVYPGTYTYDRLCPHAIESGIVDLAGCDVITAIHEIPTLEQYKQKMQGIPLHASPNPSNTGVVLLEMENTGLFPKLQLKVFDVFGNQFHKETVYPQQGAVRLYTSQWPASIYVATIFTNGQIKGKCKIVVSH